VSAEARFLAARLAYMARLDALLCAHDAELCASHDAYMAAKAAYTSSLLAEEKRQGGLCRELQAKYEALRLGEEDRVVLRKLSDLLDKLEGYPYGR
jgi:diphthamide biosynthesis methyltransferase